MSAANARYAAPVNSGRFVRRVSQVRLLAADKRRHAGWVKPIDLSPPVAVNDGLRCAPPILRVPASIRVHLRLTILQAALHRVQRAPSLPAYSGCRTVRDPAAGRSAPPGHGQPENL